ncbi:M24 family metallopeptidase [Temperatibacter marinus]|uniref:M24 family metallopeptidase n=1 Tax=Temperatibacter marinus TaxID=1456591 RepID=A0AA52EEW7_9PROT|nr:M24 family metallopeptidase [Temperatibacter marinus]WND03450.1 M24 family metallopeptidase [Temperatibacter marinus]
MKHIVGILILSSIMSIQAHAQKSTTYPKVKSMQERAALEDAWLEKRFETVIPKLMRERGVDMWLMIAREYNEDPVVKTMLPATWLSARRRTILIFHDTGNTVKRYAVSRYAVGSFFEAVWNPEKDPDQWHRLNEFVTELNPKKIAINTSNIYALASGLTASQHAGLMRALHPNLKAKIVTDPALAIGWLEERIPEEMALYPEIVQLAHAIIKEGFSNKVIVPEQSSVDDVRWWYRDKIRQMGVVAWFHPSVSIQRRDGLVKDKIIRRGDLLHVDFGITYMGLNTDTQQHAYVLNENETAVPKGIQQAFKVGNRLQDILTNNYKTGLSGDQVLAKSRADAIKEGIVPSIYTHPIGYHGHGAGATIGMWDSQNGVKGRGLYPIRANTAWSIELNATVSIREWDNQKIRIMLEEDAYFDGTSVRYISGRQEKIHVIN